MATLLLRLQGPMQSWGTTSRFTQRDTGREPSKSGVIGLLAAALGIDRENWIDLQPLTGLTMAVRHDRPGIPKRDFQTAGCADSDSVIKADGKPSKDGVISHRDYLADATFLVGLEGDDRALLGRAHQALADPAWPLALGRYSYVPSEPVWLEGGLVDGPLAEVIASWPWLGHARYGEIPPSRLRVSRESDDGSGVLRMDQPLSSFAERRFGARYIQSEWTELTRSGDHATP